MTSIASHKVAIVTGANRGIGFALVRKLCKVFGDNGSVYLTARDQKKGEAACDELKKEGLSPKFHILDIANETTIETFAKHIQTNHGKCDILFNNAAMAPKPETDAAEAETILKVNNFGTYNMCKHFLPLMNAHGRIIIVSSEFGTLNNVCNDKSENKDAVLKLKEQWKIENLTIDKLHANLNQYIEDYKNNKIAENGWNPWVNAISKAGLIVLAKLLSKEFNDKPMGLIINACCPGWTYTETVKGYLESNEEWRKQAKQPDEVAEDLVWIAMLPENVKEPRGRLVKYKGLRGYDETETQEIKNIKLSV